ncbi:MAG: TraR/DksA C4-type zinc finger protein [Armatimonadota bacterium]
MATRRLDVEKFRKILLDERTRLLEQIKRLQRRSDSEDQSDEFGELADYDNHPADAASETYEREKDLAMDENIDDMLEEIDRALEKIDAGNYGTCDRCGRDISKARLEAVPYAAFCIECQDLVEGR